MSSYAATAIGLLLYAAALVPLALAVWRPKAFVPLLGAVAMAVISMAFVQTGTFQRGQLAPTEVSDMLGAAAVESRCNEVLDALREAQVVLGRPDAAGLVVNGQMWDQIPPPLQDSILTCGREAAGEAAPDPFPLIRH